MRKVGERAHPRASSAACDTRAQGLCKCFRECSGVLQLSRAHPAVNIVLQQFHATTSRVGIAVGSDARFGQCSYCGGD